MTTELNASIRDLPIPKRMQRLQVSPQGYPVPWFVPWRDGVPIPQAADTVKWSRAVRHNLCWVCGEKTGVHKAFVIGPMCMVNRVTAEPPCHLECAEYTVKACPFLSRPNMKRNPNDKEKSVPTPGIMIDRNPGVAVIWISKTFKITPDGKGGRLISIGDPEAITCWREGRRATRAEVDEAIRTGLPSLQKYAFTFAAREQLNTQIEDTRRILDFTYA